MRGLYVHIPFCKNRCYYCDFSSTTVDTPKFRQEFFEAVRKQVRFVQNRFGRLAFDTFYIGGGTPSRLTIDEMNGLFELIRSGFEIRAGAEITCEVNPGDATKDLVKGYRKLGINRISLGAQAFQDSILESIGRPHGVREVFEAFQLFREAGFDNISLDVIIRLPGQTIADVRESLDQIVNMNPEQVTVYDLDVHKKTVFGVQQARGELELPGPELHGQMFQMVEESLGAAGYHYYELMTFAKPGFESKHNLIYWRNQEYLGLGPSAVSYLNGVRFELAHDVRKYIEKCLKDDFRPEVEDVLTPEQKEIETLLTGLRLSEGVSFDLLKLIWPKIQEKIVELESAGLLRIRNDRVFLTAEGRRFNETVFAELAGMETENKH